MSALTVRSALHALRADWQQLTEGLSQSRLRRWAHNAPVMAHFDALESVVAAARGEAGPHAPDSEDVYRALLDLSHQGDDVATKAVLMAMLPRLMSTARRCQHRFDSVEDAESAAVTAMLGVIRQTSPQHPGRVCTRLAMGTLNTIAGKHLPPPARLHEMASGSPSEIEAAMALAASPDEHPLGSIGRVFELLAWAEDIAAITPEDAVLLRRAYAVDRHPHLRDLAAELDVSYPALRQRLSRAVARLRQAVLDNAAD